MSIKAVCPNNPKHKEFLTTAHVMEAWKVDEHGQFIAVVKGLQTEHGPDPGNIWNCHKCGAQATVTTD
jgi:succinate dehydrogenase/fumarate reductase-like Fe-S protein